MRILRLKIVVILLLMFTVGNGYGFLFDPPSGVPMVIKAKSKVFLCSSLKRMDMLSLASNQHDHAAFSRAIDEGAANGEIVFAPAGTEVYFVKRQSNKIIQVRPVGGNELYYTSSDLF